METYLGHLQVNVAAGNLGFYKELMAFLGWDTLIANDEMAGFGGKTSLWFIAGAKDVANDYDGPGTNHIGIGANSIADVDTVAAYLKEKGIPALFETPRHRPEFSGGEEGQTYYQVMFASPDNLLFEIVYTGPLS
jgi:catechol 2,3-dioxygenase-like lactoylglutathione lyase family enzyme